MFCVLFRIVTLSLCFSRVVSARLRLSSTELFALPFSQDSGSEDSSGQRARNFLSKFQLSDVVVVFSFIIFHVVVLNRSIDSFILSRICFLFGLTMSDLNPTLCLRAPCPGAALNDDYSIAHVEFQTCNGVVVKRPSSEASEDPVTVDKVVGLLRFLKPRVDPRDDPDRYFEKAWFLELFASHVKRTRRDPVNPEHHIARIHDIEGAYRAARLWDCPM